MFRGHENGFKNGLVMLTWALSAVATGTGFYLVHRENDLSTTEKGYLIAAATLTAVALFFLTLIGTDYLVDVINMEEYHLHGLVLSWALLVSAMGIWWWVYNTRLVDRDDQFLLTSAITSTIAVAFLTGAVFMERGERIPVLEKIERGVTRTVRAVTPGRGKKSPGRPRKSPSPTRRSPKKKVSSKRK